MLKNYLLIAFRNLRRNKVFSSINLMGLSIGMASAILILLWIQNEVSFDRFHAKKDRLYKMYNPWKCANVYMCKCVVCGHFHHPTFSHFQIISLTTF